MKLTDNIFYGKESELVNLNISGAIFIAIDTKKVYIDEGSGFEILEGAGGGLNNVVEDTTPQLGGNLDTQTFTVDGRDVSADGAKLDGIEAGATADQTAGEIKTAYESNADTNAFTDAEQTKVGNAIESKTTGEPVGATILLNGVAVTTAQHTAGPTNATTFYFITDAV